MKEDFRKRVEEIKEFLPPMPLVMNELVELLHDENVDLRTLGKVISKDPAMSVNVLRIANSAFYGLQSQVKTIEHAVTMLGIKEITSLCMACGTSRALRTPAGHKGIDLHAFWRHSVATAVITKIFCSQMGGTQVNVYLAGLLHDVGKAILGRFFYDSYQEIVRLTYKENVPIVEAEMRVIGETHGTVGKWLMEAWKLPVLYSEVAAHHHAVMSSSAENRVVVAAIALCDQIARLKGFGFGGDETGVVLADTDAFMVLKQFEPPLGRMDVATFVMDLDRADNQIADLERMMNA